MKKFYITTTLPYVNAEPHLGFALEIIQADFVARYNSLIGDNVVFNTGTDEHGLKIYRKALEAEKDPQSYVDEYAAKFENLRDALNLSYTNFIRTTDPRHIKAAQEFWQLCDKNGDIYKKPYQIKYCVGCELEKTESELEEGKCPIHPNLELEIIEEENYFFRWSKYQKPLLEFYDQNPHFVVPSFRFDEIKKFVNEGLHDFSISRLKTKMPWGVPVPNDPNHVMFVWFDALINYISTLGWPDNQEKFNAFWPGVQIAGKDNLRQQSAMWQAMLMSAGLPNSKQIIIHGFITSGGQKMSKSLGNVIDPYEIVKKYGTDALRYWVAGETHPFEDSDFTWDKFNESYNANLANGLGNLVARLAKLIENHQPIYEDEQVKDFSPYVKDAFVTFQFNEALAAVWMHIKNMDKLLNEWEPWKKTGIAKHIYWTELIRGVRQIAYDLQPFLPETAEKILKQFFGKVKSQPPLFPRLR